MIYYVSKEDREFKSTSIVQSSLNECLAYFSNKEFVAVDTETTGLDCFSDRVFLLQLGDFENQFVIDLNIALIKPYKELLETKLLLLQNAKFDLKFLYKAGIIPTKVYDTMLAEQVLYNGLDPVINLAYLAKKYCDKTLDKTVREDIARAIIDEKVIVYGAEDVQYLSKIREKQLRYAENAGVSKAIDLENAFVKSLAYAEFCGIYLDRTKWVNKYSSAHEELEKITQQLDDYVRVNKYTKYLSRQLSFLHPDPVVDINWNSSKQVIPLFKDIGIDVRAETESGESISSPILVKQKDAFDIIPLYLRYKTVMKDFSTYGEKFLENIHPITGRIHTSFFQLMSTSRLSSTKPNIQNIPSDERTRSCFVSEEGNMLVDSDYSGQEDVLFVNYSQEKKMIEFYNGEFSDGHSYVAKLCFPKELENIELKDIKKLRPDLRSLAKSAKFAIVKMCRLTQ